MDGGNLDIQNVLKSYDKQGVNQLDMQVLIGVLKVPVRIVGYKLDSLQAQKKLSASKRVAIKINLYQSWQCTLPHGTYL